MPSIGIRTNLVRHGSKLKQKPLIATLTATGTGAGVSILRLFATEDITLTLTDSARFYDNAAGTTNEGTTRTVVAGGMRTFYLKCPSGTASLIFSDVRNLLYIGDNLTNGWESSTNAASITFNVAVLNNLTYIRISGNNTIYGDISGLVKLSYITVQSGSNTITGSITGLTDLIFVNIAGSSTIYGDLGGSGMSAVSYGLERITLANTNKMDTYTAGAVWSNAVVVINPAVGYGYSSAEIDNMLIDMANSAGGPTGKTITLQGSSQPRTSASDAAVATLQGRGCTIITNITN